MKKLYLLFIVLALPLANFAQPVITSFFPSSGPIGTVVTITGTNFNPVISDNVIYFGATKAVINSATNDTLKVVVPFGATHESITVTDLVTHLTAFSSKPFDVTFSCAGINAGSFAPHEEFATGTWTGKNAVGDLDGDSKPDLVVAHGGIGGNVSVLRNTSVPGTISFAPILTLSGHSPSSIFLSDLDGDGKLDVILANGCNGQFSTYLNTSTPGTISFGIKVDHSSSGYPSKLALADFNNDGKQDIVYIRCSSFTNIMYILKNTSSAGIISFMEEMSMPLFGAPSGYIDAPWQSVNTGDINYDGKLDIIVAAGGGIHTFSVFKNIGSGGTFAFDTRLDFTSGSYIAGISVDDLDRDGKPDIVTGHDSNYFKLFRNTSSSTLITFATAINFTLIHPIEYVTTGDLDGDQLPEIITSVAGEKLGIRKNLSSPGVFSFAPAIQYPVFQTPLDVYPADLDSDGKPDLTVSNSGSVSFAGCSILRNLGSFSEPVAINDTICGTGIPLISATGARPGENYKWYDSLTGGNLVQLNGATYTASPVTATTTLYVTQYDTLLLCESNTRIPVIAYINSSPPSAPTITVSGSSLTSDAAYGNQWYLNGTILPGDTLQTYTAPVNGTYYSTVTSNGCTSPASTPVMVTEIGINELNDNNLITVFPNPFSDKTTLEIKSLNNKGYAIRIVDLLGKKIADINPTAQKVEIKNTGYKPGVYFIQLMSEATILAVKKIVIE